MPEPTDTSVWPGIALADWKDTCTTLHMWTQIVGKVRLELSPYWNHWWQVPLYVTARGLSTSPIPYGPRIFEIDFDFIDHRLVIKTSAGEVRQSALTPRSVADFYEELMATLRDLDIEVSIDGKPDEVPDPIPFAEDREHDSYDRDAVNRFWRVLVQADRLFKEFRGQFIGKCSPVHFFWGAFDLAVTRFSGKRAPERPEADAITREGYSHEVISHGFWPGTGAIDASFYSYTAPEPEGFDRAGISPAEAFYSKDTKGFLLPYEAVRTSGTPDVALMDFLRTTYEAGANLAGWDREALEARAF